jgi:hypothetical protein
MLPFERFPRAGPISDPARFVKGAILFAQQRQDKGLV